MYRNPTPDTYQSQTKLRNDAAHPYRAPLMLSTAPTPYLNFKDEAAKELALLRNLSPPSFTPWQQGSGNAKKRGRQIKVSAPASPNGDNDAAVSSSSSKKGRRGAKKSFGTISGDSKRADCGIKKSTSGLTSLYTDDDDLDPSDTERDGDDANVEGKEEEDLDGLEDVHQ